MESTGSLKERVYRALVKDITCGVFPPNSIITEGSLIKRFEVSKAPVREALIELCKDNYLQSIPRLGYMVVPCSLKEIIDILDFRVDLEVSNLRRAIPRLNDDSLAVFKSYSLWENDEFSKHDIAENWMHNQQFHLLLCSLSGNAYAYRILEQLLKQNARFFSQYYSYAWDKKTESKGKFHESIISALRERDWEKACSLLTADINAVKDLIQKVLVSERHPG